MLNSIQVFETGLYRVLSKSQKPTLNLKILYTIYRISANSFRGNYSFLSLTLCTVTFVYSTYRCGNYSRAKTIRGNTVLTYKYIP